MADYTELIKDLRHCATSSEACASCNRKNERHCQEHLHAEAADAIEELLKAAKKMHTWIFLHSYDEQEAYDECGLSDEMNAALGYGGRFEIKADP